MIIPISVRDPVASTVLTPQERMVLERLQWLATEGKEEADPEVIALADRHIKWSLDDPDSLTRAAFFLAHAPFIQREIKAINAEFSAAEVDGMEDY
jgi:hypothetical protein